MIVAYSIQRCPACRKYVDSHFFLVSSGLGPSTFTCAKCGKEFLSGRVEWPDMKAIGRLRYFIVSLVYAGVVGMLVCMATVMTVGALAGEKHLKSSLSLTAIAIGAFFTLGFQVLRVSDSRDRVQRAAVSPYHPTFFSRGVNLHLQVTLVWLVVFVAAIACALAGRK